MRSEMKTPKVLETNFIKKLGAHTHLLDNYWVQNFDFTYEQGEIVKKVSSKYSRLKKGTVSIISKNLNIIHYFLTPSTQENYANAALIWTSLKINEIFSWLISHSSPDLCTWCTSSAKELVNCSSYRTLKSCTENYLSSCELGKLIRNPNFSRTPTYQFSGGSEYLHSWHCCSSRTSFSIKCM